MKNRSIAGHVLLIVLCVCLTVLLYCSIRRSIRQMGYDDGKLAAYSALREDDLCGADAYLSFIPKI